MVEGTVKSGQNESFPLLKENSLKGCGDCCSRSPSRADDNNATHQSILIEDKKTWLPQWTGLLTVCWVLSFVLAMGLAGQILASCFITTFAPHSLLLSPCYFNESIRSNRLFLIELVPRSMNVGILQYTEYLSNMANNYRNLNITVIFLLDDGYRRRNGFKKLFFGESENIRTPIISQNDIMGQHMLNSRFENLEVKFVNVSSLLNRRMLPFRVRFYAKVFYTWMYGGVALDLFSCYLDYINNYSNYRYLDMLNFFNDNVNIEAYTNFLERSDDYQETEGQVIVASRFEIIFNPETMNLTNETTTRTKREGVDGLTSVWTTNNTNFTGSQEVVQLNMNTTGNDLTNTSYFNNLTNATTILTYLYDFAILRPIKAIYTDTSRNNDARSMVIIDSDGMFLASSAPRHPFIGDILKTYNKHSYLTARTRISYVIKNIYLVTCGSKYVAPYCRNVYIL